MPWALQFLLSYQGDVGGVSQEALPAVGNYLNFVLRFLFGFGAAFLLPILLMILERAGIVREQWRSPPLRRRRRGCGFRCPDPARCCVDAAAARAALCAVRVRDPCDPPHALARGAESCSLNSRMSL